MLFTADPVTGERTRVAEATHGGADRVVSGTETPDQYRLAAGGTLLEQDLADAARGPALSADRHADLAALADRIDEWAEGEQSVEWAINAEDGQLAVLQSRPLH